VWESLVARLPPRGDVTFTLSVAQLKLAGLWCGKSAVSLGTGPVLDEAGTLLSTATSVPSAERCAPADGLSVINVFNRSDILSTPWVTTALWLHKHDIGNRHTTILVTTLAGASRVAIGCGHLVCHVTGMTAAVALPNARLALQQFHSVLVGPSSLRKVLIVCNGDAINVCLAPDSAAIAYCVAVATITVIMCEVEPAQLTPTSRARRVALSSWYAVWTPNGIIPGDPRAVAECQCCPFILPVAKKLPATDSPTANTYSRLQGDRIATLLVWLPCRADAVVRALRVNVRAIRDRASVAILVEGADTAELLKVAFRALYAFYALTHF